MFIANGRTVYRYSPANPAFFRWQSSWNAQAQRATLESSSHRPRTDKRKGRALFVAAKSGGGARLLGFHAHGASFLPPAQIPQSRQAVPLPPGLCACNGMREASSTSRTDPSPPGHSASSWVLCVRRRACKVPSSRPHRSPNPGEPFHFLLVFVRAAVCAHARSFPHLRGEVLRRRAKGRALKLRARPLGSSVS